MGVGASSVENSTSARFYTCNRRKVFSKEGQDESTRRASGEGEEQGVTAKAHCQFGVYCRLESIDSTNEVRLLPLNFMSSIQNSEVPMTTARSVDDEIVAGSCLRSCRWGRPPKLRERVLTNEPRVALLPRAP